MINKHKPLIHFIVLLILIILNSHLVLAAWYNGAMHIHTGFSTETGYDGIEGAGDDDCSELVEGYPWVAETGKDVSLLKNDALILDLSFLSFTDHSYCMDSDEFNTVKTDCLNAEDSGTFTCLAGEEVSAKEVVTDLEFVCTIYDYYGEAHVGAHGINTYISQTPADEHCPDTPTVTSTITSINTEGISIANHPYLHEAGIEFLDFESIDSITGETGIEIWNEEWDEYDEDAVDVWSDKLLDGEIVYAYGGADSHEEITTVNTNYAYVEGTLNSANLETALENGRVTVTNNGLIYIEAKGEYDNDWTLQGSPLDVCDDDTIQINASYDISHNCELTIYKEDSGTFMCAEDIKL